MRRLVRVEGSLVRRAALALALVVTAAAGLAGCNTVAGVGQDISDGARALQRQF